LKSDLRSGSAVIVKLYITIKIKKQRYIFIKKGSTAKDRNEILDCNARFTELDPHGKLFFRLFMIYSVNQHLDNNRSQYLQLVLPVVIMRAIYQSLKRVPEAVDGLSTRIVSRSQTNVQKDPSVRTNNLLTSRGSKKVFGTVQSRFFQVIVLS
jgi:hypothetical protein